MKDKLRTYLNGISIGERIKEVLKANKKTTTWVSRELGCERTNIYNIFQRHSIDTLLLKRICIVLKHDFFKDLSDEIRKDIFSK